MAGNNKVFVGRIQLLHDIEAHWQKVANTFIPLPGEACITLDSDNKGRVKYGDGIHTWGELPYSNDNHYDGKTIVSTNHVIQVKGYESAEIGQAPLKSQEGLTWFTPVKSVKMGNTEVTLTPTESGAVSIPIAGEGLGLVKASEEIGVDESGSLKLLKVPVKALDASINAGSIPYKDDDSIGDALDEIYDRIKWKKF